MAKGRVYPGNLFFSSHGNLRPGAKVVRQGTALCGATRYREEPLSMESRSTARIPLSVKPCGNLGTEASATFVITSIHEIYKRAIKSREAKEMCFKYEELKRKLGEIDRARAVYAHAS
ncbi:hypothetical protein BC937DRAFT_89033 [Endogone sp. FLAS-F59071]|nr:hypothetical protein BC937DRAFT_89033 [Endogone sp. FLAS-F59071]|eukprot:RUS18217.1 hypothetical protein BC937DRAFT_89033 [Endogone sp. FLAS-F59071]